LNAAALLTVDASAPIEEFRAALASDSSWCEALERESANTSLRPKILFEHHDSHLAGHPGRAKTIELIARDYSWPGLSNDIRRYVRSCDLCQRNKSSHHAPYGDLVPLEIPSRNWESISMDFITDLPLSHGFDTLLVVVDRLSKQAHFVPTVKTLDAAGLAQLYIASIFKLHGLPSSIVSDRGSTFTSLFWTEVTSRLGIQLKLSTSKFLFLPARRLGGLDGSPHSTQTTGFILPSPYPPSENPTSLPLPTSFIIYLLSDPNALLLLLLPLEI